MALKKFTVVTIERSYRNKPKTHAIKTGKKNRSWCGCVFKKSKILNKSQLTIEHITCQKCLNTINANIKYVSVK
jgi:hypothetical protein